MSPELARRLVTIMLRLGGVVTGSAFLAMVMPGEWMVSIHRALGLGELPRAPIVDYLTRSVAAMYGAHGVLLLVISTNPVQYRRIVQTLGVMNVVFGVCLTTIDLHAGLPWWWTAGEGPSVVVIGVLLLYFIRFC